MLLYSKVMYISLICIYFVFFFNDTATTEIYTLSLHDALPISTCDSGRNDSFRSLVSASSTWCSEANVHTALRCDSIVPLDRKSTRLNSSHANISYAVFCLKKKKKNMIRPKATINYNNTQKNHS